jgi:hypothetical protein
MARRSLVRGAAAGGVLFLALAAGTGIASAADPYGGSSASGVTTSGGGEATFTGNGFFPGTAVALTVTSCGITSNLSGTAANDGSVAIPTSGAGQTTFTATGVDGSHQPLTETSSAVLDATCSGAAGGGGGSGSGGGGGLPFTGFEVGAASVLGIGAIGAGVIVIVASRRRRRDHAAV